MRAEHLPPLAACLALAPLCTAMGSGVTRAHSPLTVARCLGRAPLLFDVNGVFMGEADDEMPPTRLPCALVALPCSDELSASSEVEGDLVRSGGSRCYLTVPHRVRKQTACNLQLGCETMRQR